MCLHKCIFSHQHGGVLVASRAPDNQGGRAVEELVLEHGVDVNAPCSQPYVTLHNMRWEGLNRTALHFAGAWLPYVPL